MTTRHRTLPTDERCRSCGSTDRAADSTLTGCKVLVGLNGSRTTVGLAEPCSMIWVISCAFSPASACQGCTSERALWVSQPTCWIVRYVSGRLSEDRAMLLDRCLAAPRPGSDQSVCPLKPRGNVLETISVTRWSPAIPAQSEQPGRNSDDRLCPSLRSVVPRRCLCTSLSGWFSRSLITESHARSTPAFPQRSNVWYGHVSHQPLSHSI